MPREGYQKELDHLRAGAVELGNAVVDQLDDGLTALETRDEDFAKSVIADDEKINERYLALESDCVDLFALQQPVASDLRFVAASFKIITDLERVGDLASNLAGYAIGSEDDSFSDVDVIGIGTEARAMVTESIDAYANSDVSACREIAERDDEIDALCAQASDRVVRELIETELDGTDAWEIERFMDEITRVLLTIRDLERVADHAVNIAARTLYMVESDPTLIY